MSDNKSKYFVVDATFVVRARNKSDALKEVIKRNARRTSDDHNKPVVISSDIKVNRVLARDLVGFVGDRFEIVESIS